MDIEKRAAELLGKMTLAEKIGQLTQYMFSADDAERLKQCARDGKIGSIVLSSTAFAGDGDREKLAHDLLDEIQKCAAEESRLGIPILYGRDVIHGHRVVFPVPLAQAAAFNDELVERSYECIAEEAANDGVRWSFAPMLDVSRDPRWGRCIESPGEDPYLGERAARAVVKGFQKNKRLAACAKHYIGYGASEGGRDYHRTEISDYTLRNVYLRAFKSAVDAGAATVMTAFNDVSGQPVTSSKYLLRDVLRGELGFSGVTVSDWGAVEQLQNQGVAKDRAECTEMSINAGLDMDMCSFCYEENLEELVKSGRVSEKTVDEAVLRVLRLKLEYGLFDSPYTDKSGYNVGDHVGMAYYMAAESMVLLKNNGILPLKRDTKTALIGPMLDERRALLGSWTLDGDVGLVKSMREAFTASLADGCAFAADTGLRDEMLFNVRKSDVVIAFLGESHRANGEMHSLADIDIPEAQVELVRTAHALGKPVIGVMLFGRPVGLEKIEPYLSGILWGWQSGTMTTQAAADIIFGRINPSGRLPMTLPRRTGQIPLYYNVTPSGRAVNGYYGEEAIFNYDDCLGSPMYPFGYGLSYTEFEYGGISADRSEISLSELENGGKIRICTIVSNVGAKDGAEVVQLYLRDEISSVMRPVRELKGARKVTVARGENAAVSFEIGCDELGFYGADGKFTAEPGDFVIYIGKNCLADDCIRITVTP